MPRVTNVELDTFDVSSTTYEVDVASRLVKVEQWATNNSSGTEYYSSDGLPIPYQDVPSELDEYDPTEDPGVIEFWRRYHDEVEPLVDRIKRETFGTVEEAVEE